MDRSAAMKPPGKRPDMLARGQRLRRCTVLRALLLALALPLALAGCSVIEVFYERLDTLALREAGRWLDLDAEQEARLRIRLEQRLAQHRREELPRYAHFLEQGAGFVESGATPEQLQQSFGLLRELLRDALRHSVPVLAPTLAELEPAQVAHFARALEESNEEYRKEYLAPSPATRRGDRLEAAEDGIERWSGRLQPAQRELLAQMVDAMPDDAGLWFERRLQWQRGVLELLREGAGPEAHAAYLEGWWLDDARFDAAHAAQMQKDATAAAAAMAGLIASLDRAQRSRAAERLRSTAAEFRSLHAQALPARDRPELASRQPRYPERP